MKIELLENRMLLNAAENVTEDVDNLETEAEHTHLYTRDICIDGNGDVVNPADCKNATQATAADVFSLPIDLAAGGVEGYKFADAVLQLTLGRKVLPEKPSYLGTVAKTAGIIAVTETVKFAAFLGLTQWDPPSPPDSSSSAGSEGDQSPVQQAIWYAWSKVPLFIQLAGTALGVVMIKDKYDKYQNMAKGEYTQV